jgi:NDP-sugar pyrophosphorylase family protein
MNIVIPMAGRGSRFYRAGYNLPKMLIEAHGKNLLQWSLDSLPLELASRIIFVGLEEHREVFDLEQKIYTLYGEVSDLKFIWLPDVTRGQAETVFLASDHIVPDEALLIFNIDTNFSSSTLAASLQRHDVDGVLGGFHSSDPHFSFARVDKSGFVNRIVEKEVISNCALTGLYHCSKAEDFLKVTEQAIAENRVTKGEFYVAPLLQELVSLGHKFIVDYAEEHHVLGTPEELEQFIKLEKFLVIDPS